MNKIDLTGQRFGKLTVLRENEAPYTSPGGKKTRRWDCVCDCGNHVTVLQNVLTGKNGTRSCGCSRELQRMGNLAGKRFGRLIVIEPARLDRTESNRTRNGWRCRCDCGKEIVLPTRYLTSGEKNSCGCLLAESSAARVNEAVGHYAGTTISGIRPERGPNKNNTSGVKGVYWSSREQLWIAKIGVQSKNITLGRFRSLDDAEKARKEAEEKYYAPIIDAYEKEHESKKTNKADPD